jgi:hypothetical protein
MNYSEQYWRPLLAARFRLWRKIEKGNLSNLITRWVEAGVMIRIGPERLPLHVYPLSKSAIKSEEKLNHE